jgi:putrescine aminotransferase
MIRVMPKYDVENLRRLDVAHHLHPQADHGLMERMGGSRIITRGEGCLLYGGNGEVLLDGMAGLWCVQVGHGREELAQAAYDQMREIAFYNTVFKTAAPPTIELAAKVASLLGGKLSHVFFNNSGSEAVDTALRLARYYWQAKGQPDRSVIIGRVNGYHGSTLAGVSMGGMKHMHAQGGPWVPGIEHIMQPYAFEAAAEDPEEFGRRAANDLEDRILDVGPERVAAFMAETVQGVGGVIIPPKTYWPRIKSICRKYGILLICDEVICGFGRLGEWFGYQHFGLDPDLVTMAKGISSGQLPISAVGVSEDIVGALRAAGTEFEHGYTYSGHPTCAAVALKNLEIMEREDLVRRTREVTGPYLAEGLAVLASHPLVGEVRSLGLIGAVEIVADKTTRARFGGKAGTAGPLLRDQCIANGLMIRSNDDTLLMSPPLVISLSEIDQMLAIIHRSLDEIAPILKARHAMAAPSLDDAAA